VEHLPRSIDFSDQPEELRRKALPDASTVVHRSTSGQEMSRRLPPGSTTLGLLQPNRSKVTASLPPTATQNVGFTQEIPSRGPVPTDCGAPHLVGPKRTTRPTASTATQKDGAGHDTSMRLAPPSIVSGTCHTGGEEESSTLSWNWCSTSCSGVLSWLSWSAARRSG